MARLLLKPTTPTVAADVADRLNEDEDSRAA
jgi:hypothetical protein